MSIISKALILVTAAFLSMSFAATPPVWTAELILDDFEDLYGDPINRTALGAVKSYSANQSYTKGKFGYWYVFSGNGGIITNAGDVELDEDNIATAFDETDKCMHVKFDAEDDESYAAIATNLFNEGDWVNLSKMTSFSFKAKGTGSVRIYFKSKYFKNKKYTWGDIGYSVDLTTAYKTYPVTLADLEPAPYSDAEEDGVTWDDCKDSITSVAIEITTNTDEEGKIPTEVWIDDIVFKGMKYCDIVDTNITSVRYSANSVVASKAKNFAVSNNAISYTIAQPQNVSFSILDLNGTIVGRINGKNSAGSHSVALPKLSAGNYLVKMNGINASQQITIVK